MGAPLFGGDCAWHASSPARASPRLCLVGLLPPVARGFRPVELRFVFFLFFLFFFFFFFFFFGKWRRSWRRCPRRRGHQVCPVQQRGRAGHPGARDYIDIPLGSWVCGRLRAVADGGGHLVFGMACTSAGSVDACEFGDRADRPLHRGHGGPASTDRSLWVKQLCEPEQFGFVGTFDNPTQVRASHRCCGPARSGQPLPEAAALTASLKRRDTSHVVFL